MRMGERKRERKRERDGQTKNKQRNTCREWNKPKRRPENKKAINQTSLQNAAPREKVALFNRFNEKLAFF